MTLEGTSEHISAAAESEETAERREAVARLDAIEEPRGTNGHSEEVGAVDGKGERVRDAMFISPADTLPELEPREPASITLRNLLEAGVHFGHQTARWNPKMAPYIYGARNGIHIINLPRTISSWEVARKAIVEVSARGGSVLFVGTKKQAQDAVVTEARRCGAHYVSRRWLGGMMTNFQTIRKSIARLNKVEEILNEEERALNDGVGVRYTKKERLMMSRERDKLYHSLGGIREMYSAPQLMFIIDIKREDIAVREAQRLDIPVVALVDTNCDPSVVTHAIPSNDDGTRAIRLFCEAVADAVLEGRKTYEERKSVMSGAGADVQSSTRGGRRASAKNTAPSAKAEAPVAEEAAKPAASEEPKGDSAVAGETPSGA